MKRLAHCIATFVALLMLTISGADSARAADVQLSVSLDSAYLLMGNATPLHVRLLAPADTRGHLLVPSDSMCGNVEILRGLQADTSSAGNGRMELNGDILIQSFDSGVYLLKPILFVDGNETIASKRLALKVLPVDVDSLKSIHDFADAQDVSRKWYDYLPDIIVDHGLLALIVLLVIAAGFFIWYKYFRHKEVKETKPEKQLSPYDKAIMALDVLKAQSLCEKGHEKEFYTRLTDILRDYLHGRFGINAMEMTSSQIRRAISSNADAKPSRQYVDRVLEIADFVKFAKMRPLPDDNIDAFNSALKFINDTKPVVVIPEAKDGQPANATPHKQSQHN